MKTFVVFGLGYEDSIRAFEVIGDGMDEYTSALRKIYFEISGEDEEYFKEELEDMIREEVEEDEADESEEDREESIRILFQYKWEEDDEYWSDKIDEMDTADFVLGAIYDVDEKGFIYNREDGGW